MSILICLIGAQGSGKSTIEKWVNEELNVPRLISYTTRPRRLGEREDEYHFVSDAEFELGEVTDGGFAEKRTYKVADGSFWKYGVHKSSITEPVYVVVVDYEGFEALRENYKVIGIHLDITKTESYRRVLSNRPDYSREECERRFASDVIDIQQPALADELIVTLNSEQDINETKREIKNLVTLAKMGMSEMDIYLQWKEERMWEHSYNLSSIKDMI